MENFKKALVKATNMIPFLEKDIVENKRKLDLCAKLGEHYEAKRFRGQLDRNEKMLLEYKAYKTALEHYIKEYELVA